MDSNSSALNCNIHVLAVMFLAAPLLTSVGCSAGSEAAHAEVARQVTANERRAEEARADPMRPMLGTWVIDLAATLAENPSMPEDKQAAIRKHPASQRFEVTITDRDYISRSLTKTMADRYTVVGVDGESVTIALNSADGVERDTNRQATLQLRDGQLLVTTRGPVYGITAVMSRSTVGE